MKNPHSIRSCRAAFFPTAFAAALAAGLMAPHPARALTLAVWDSTAGNWSDATHWSSNPAFPNDGGGNFYDATVNGGNVSVDGNFLVSKFTLTGGTLSGINTLTSNGLINWTGGTMSGGGVTNANGGLSLDSTGVYLVLDTRTLNNAAGQTATWTNAAASGGGIAFQNGATINNNGTFLAQGDHTILNFGSGGIFNNAGTFTRNSNVGTLLLGSGIAFNNTGTVNVQTGLLDLQGGDTGNTTGAFNVSAGATLKFDSSFTLAIGSSVAGAGTVSFGSGTTNVGGSYNVTGTSTISGATVNFNSTITSLGGSGGLNISNGTGNFNANDQTVSTLNLSGGTLGGSGTISSSGLLNWTGGTMSGSGVTNANGGLSLDSTGVYLVLDTRTLNNAAGQTATWTNAAASGGGLAFQNGAMINNNGTFLAQGDHTILTFGGGGIFNNAGTFTRNSNVGTLLLGSGIAFNNTGTVNVQTGALLLQGGGASTGVFTTSAGASCEFSGQQYTLNTGTSFSGAGAARLVGGELTVAGAAVTAANFTVAGGTLDGPGSMNSSGLLSWTGGTMSGSGVTNADGGLSLNSTGVYLTLSTRTLNNAAGQTATWTNAAASGGGFAFQSGATINNNGAFLAQGDQGIYSFGGGGIFNNVGTFTRNSNGGTLTLFSGIVFNNIGTVNAQTGALVLQAAGASTGVFATSPGADLDFASQQYILNTGTSFSGAGAARLVSGELTVAAPTVAATNFIVAGGTLDGPGSLNTSGLLNWTGGTMSGSGVTNANGGLNLNSTGVYLVLDTRTLINAAGQTATWTNAAASGGGIAFQNGATFNNNGTFLAQGDHTIYNFGGGGTFNNAGTFTRNSNGGTLTLGGGTTFNNTGTVDVQSGTLSLAGTVTNFNGVTNALSGGIWKATGAASILSLDAGGGNRSIQTLAGGADVTVGNATATVTGLMVTDISSGSALRATGGATVTSGGPLTNSGTVEAGAGSTVAVKNAGLDAQFIQNSGHLLLTDGTVTAAAFGITGGDIKGSGRLNGGDVSASGTTLLSPGQSIGQIIAGGNFSQTAGTGLFELGRSGGVPIADLLAADGSVAFSNVTVTLALAAGSTPLQINDTFILFRSDNDNFGGELLTLTNNTFIQNSSLAAYTLTPVQTSKTYGYKVTAATPEPGSGILAVTGFLGLLSRRRRKSRRD